MNHQRQIERIQEYRQRQYCVIRNKHRVIERVLRDHIVKGRYRVAFGQPLFVQHLFVNGFPQQKEFKVTFIDPQIAKQEHLELTLLTNQAWKQAIQFLKIKSPTSYSLIKVDNTFCLPPNASIPLVIKYLFKRQPFSLTNPLGAKTRKLTMLISCDKKPIDQKSFYVQPWLGNYQTINLVIGVDQLTVFRLDCKKQYSLWCNNPNLQYSYLSIKPNSRSFHLLMSTPTALEQHYFFNIELYPIYKISQKMGIVGEHKIQINKGIPKEHSLFSTKNQVIWIQKMQIEGRVRVRGWGNTRQIVGVKSQRQLVMAWIFDIQITRDKILASYKVEVTLGATKLFYFPYRSRKGRKCTYYVTTSNESVARRQGDVRLGAQQQQNIQLLIERSGTTSQHLLFINIQDEQGSINDNIELRVTYKKQ